MDETQGRKNPTSAINMIQNKEKVGLMGQKEFDGPGKI